MTTSSQQPPAVGELSDGQLDAVSGGHRDESPAKYMEYKLKETLITG